MTRRCHIAIYHLEQGSRKARHTDRGTLSQIYLSFIKPSAKSVSICVPLKSPEDNGLTFASENNAKFVRFSSISILTIFTSIVAFYCVFVTV